MAGPFDAALGRALSALDVPTEAGAWGKCGTLCAAWGDGMRQDETRRLFITIARVLAGVLAALTLAMLLWPETLRGMLFGAEPRSQSGAVGRLGWAGARLGLPWSAPGLLVVVIALAACGRSRRAQRQPRPHQEST